MYSYDINVASEKGIQQSAQRRSTAADLQHSALVRPYFSTSDQAKTNALVTCEIKLFQNYFRGLLQLINISNIFNVDEIILKYFSVLFHMYHRQWSHVK